MEPRDAMDAVFRALADPTRREILDALVAQDGQTVGELAERFAEQMSRFGVMKHLAVLEGAELVTTLRDPHDARAKRHYLNPVPIEQVANRWISKYAARFTSALVGLQQHLESPDPLPQEA